MRRIILILFIINAFGTIQAQNTFKTFLKDEETKEPLIFANVVVEDTKNGVSSDTMGFVELKNIPNGKQTIIFSYVGYRTKEKTFIFPLNQKRLL